jgi:hypothetical protein
MVTIPSRWPASVGLDSKAAATPVGDIGYRVLENENDRTDGGQLAAHHTTPKAERTRSMTLMPTNGATMPPNP